MSTDETLSPEALNSDPFPGGELTLARAAKLLRCSVAEIEARISGGTLAARPAPKPGGGEHTLVSLESVQAAKAAEAGGPAAPEQPKPKPKRRHRRPVAGDHAALAHRPGTAPASGGAPESAPSAPLPATLGPTDASAPLIETIDRLSAMHGELLAKMDELIEVLRQQSER